MNKLRSFFAHISPILSVVSFLLIVIFGVTFRVPRPMIISLVVGTAALITATAHYWAMDYTYNRKRMISGFSAVAWLLIATLNFLGIALGR